MKANNSVWRWPCNIRYYLTHPWKWFSQLGTNIRDIYRRARYGWTYRDVWDMYLWMLNTLPPMLHHMANKGCAYPGKPPFDTPEKWHKWLHAMADLIESGSEEKQNECNEYYKEYMDHVFDPSELRVTEMDNDYFDRAAEIYGDAKHNIEFAMTQLGKYFYNLWD